VPIRVCVGRGQAEDSEERVGMVGPQVGVTERYGPFQMRNREAVFPDAAVSIADRYPDRRLNQRLTSKTLADPGRGPVQCLPHCEVTTRRETFVKLRLDVHQPQQIVLEEVIDSSGNSRLRGCLPLGALRPLAFNLGLALGLSGQLRLPGAHDRGGKQGGHDDATRQQRPPISPRELPHSVTDRWRTRLDRLVGEVALDIGGESAGRFVTSIAVLLQGLHNDPVHLAAEELA
jgi:hypothetical protein